MSARIVRLDSSVLRQELIPQRACVTLAIIVSVRPPLPVPPMEWWVRSAQLAVTVRRAQLGPSTARVATITRTRASRLSSIVRCARQASTVMARPQLEVSPQLVPVMMDTIVWLDHPPLTSTPLLLAPYLTLTHNGRVLRTVHKPLTTTCGIRLPASPAQKASIADLLESPMTSQPVPWATIALRESKIPSFVDRELTTRRLMLGNPLTALNALQASTVPRRVWSSPRVTAPPATSALDA